MKTIKVSEASGVVLDWLVAQCEHNVGWEPEGEDRDYYCTDWLRGGPIIEREGLSLIRQTDTRWTSEYSNGCDRSDHARSWGTTPLVAAMRCYVASTLGDVVEVPEELI